jgi:conjugal transfer pilus assembly protein TraV
MKIRLISLAVIAAAAASTLLVGGCAAVNPCKTKYGGICASPREVYGVTRNRDQVNPTEATRAAQARAGKLINAAPKADEELPSIDPKNPNTLPSNVMAHAHVSADLGKVSTQGPMGITPAQDGPISQINGGHSVPYPLLKQPQVMRVWVAPFVDKQDQLHFPGYIYTVLKDKTWTFGPGSDKTAPELPSPAQAAAANPSDAGPDAGPVAGSTSAPSLGVVTR